MTVPPEFQITEADGTLRVEWDNRRVAKGGWGFLVIVWFVLAFFLTAWLSLFVGRVRSRGADGFESGDVLGIPCMIAFAWMYVYAIPHWLSARTWRERIEVTREAITHTKFGRHAPAPKVHPVAAIESVMLGWYRAMATGSTDFVQIYVLRRDRGFYGSMVEWLADPLQAQLYFVIRDFVRRHDIPIEMGEWGHPPRWWTQTQATAATKPE